MTTYSTSGDLLIGDMTRSDVVAEASVGGATDTINARLGFLYELPLPDTMPDYVTSYLKTMANLIASGRFILQQATGQEQNAENAYGRALLNEGMAMLDAAGSGVVELTGAVRLANAQRFRGPSVHNVDAASGVEAFYAGRPCFEPHRLGGTRIWAPGS